MSPLSTAKRLARRFSRFLLACSLAALCACGTAPLKGPPMCPMPPATYLLPPEPVLPLIPNCTSADDQDACIPLDQLLDNQIVNAQRCHDAREQLELLIRWHREALP